jgi:hypothetical protein
MAAPTNFIAPAGDLNTIFAPINQVDYGTLAIDNNATVGENWVSVSNMSSVSPFNNIGIENDGRSFRVHRPGLYRLCINLNFGDAQDATKQTVVFILSSLSSAPSGSDPKTNYSFTPRPNLSEIYAINCSGASSNIDSGYFQNSLNRPELLNGNCFGLNYYSNNNNLNQRPYFFTFILQNDAANEISASNFYTLDITFKTPDNLSSDNQYKIFPYIRCADDSDSNPFVTLQNAKWLFTKLSE